MGSRDECAEECLSYDPLCLAVNYQYGACHIHHSIDTEVVDNFIGYFGLNSCSDNDEPQRQTSTAADSQVATATPEVHNETGGSYICPLFVLFPQEK